MAASNRSKSQNEPKAQAPVSMNQETNIAASHAHDRLLFLMSNMVGALATITLKNSESFTGVFSAASLDSSSNCIVLKMTKRTSPTKAEQTNDETTNAGDYVGYGSDHATVFDLKDIVTVECANITTDKVSHKSSNGTSIRTDTDISGNLEIRERQLEAWQDVSDSGIGMSMNGGSSGEWDQFKTNEKLFGLRTDYDETMYTTAIDRSAPSYKERAARADRLAREIESSETSNPHVAEERNLSSPDSNGMDEEAKYSGVARDALSLTSSNPNRYTPPARRAPTGQSTVAGAPVDPAIISSSLARSDLSKLTTTPSTNPVAAVSNENSKTTTVNGNRDKALANGKIAVRMPQHKPLPKQTLEEAKEHWQTFQVPEIPTTSKHANAAHPGQNVISNNVEHVENNVRAAFKDWAGKEKLQVAMASREHQEKQRVLLQEQRAKKINDLKKFSMNFKVPSAVPTDILGILARDKEKQKELQQKAQQVAEATAASKPAAGNVAPENVLQNGLNDRQATKGARGPATVQNQSVGKSDRSNLVTSNVPQQRIPGNLGQRLLSGQYGARNSQNNQANVSAQDPRIQPPHPVAINTEVPVVRQGVLTPASAATRMRAQAVEFKPNPVASTFAMPGDQSSSSSSPVRSRTRSDVKQKPVNRVKFFRGRKPEPGTKRSLTEGFNPIARMKQEVIDAGKTKDYASNGGIPQPYRTAPTWPVSEENSEKTYVEIADKTLMPPPSASTGPFPMPHQHQLPQQFNSNYYAGPRTPSQTHYRQHQPREYFDPLRMQPGGSQSSVPPSPSMRPPVMVQRPMPYRMENGQMMYGQPSTPGGQLGHGQYLIPAGPVAPQMMSSNSNQGHFMPPHGHVPMYAPSGGHPFQQQAPQHGGFNSPRQGNMMAFPAQGPIPMQQQYSYQMPVASGFPQQGAHVQMRGGAPMMPQSSYQGSPRMGYRGGPNLGGFPPQQVMQNGQAMGPMPGGPSRHSSDLSEGR